jgi:hypothetical protein
MKKALIDPIQQRETGYRVAQVEDSANTFPVGDPYFWVDCADDVVADEFWYNPTNSTIYPLPEALLALEVNEPDMVTAYATTDVPHNLNTGASITTRGQSDPAYIGTFTITVTGATTFTYTMLSPAAGDAVSSGSYSINY